MFVPVPLLSVNRLDALPPGRYATNLIVTQDPLDPGETTFLFWYTAEGSEHPSVLDLVQRSPEGLSATDFVRMPDRSWRNHAGLRRDALRELLPKGLLDWPALETVRMADQVVRGSR